MNSFLDRTRGDVRRSCCAPVIVPHGGSLYVAGKRGLDEALRKGLDAARLGEMTVLDVSGSDVTSASVERICRAAGHLYLLRVADCPGVDRATLERVLSLPNAPLVLEIGGASASAHLSKMDPFALARVEGLVVRDCDLDAELLVSLSLALRLTRLELIRCSTGDPHTLRRVLFERCAGLRFFSAKGSPCFGAEELAALALGAPRLRSVDVSCTRVCWSTLLRIAQRARWRLNHLAAAGLLSSPPPPEVAAALRAHCDRVTFR